LFKERVDVLALAKAESVCGKPEVGYRCVPRARDIAQWRKKEVVDRMNGRVGDEKR